ncbi:MAG: potassium transporter Kup [Deltaproteobacteria bacterium]|nr:potassium transporter Kup [Deltaproteobacteria bacterium]
MDPAIAACYLEPTATPPRPTYMTEPAKADSTSSGERSSASQHHQHGHGDAPKSRKDLAAISLGALGVVYGDIGTSPLYAVRESLDAHSPHAVSPVDPSNVLGVLSLFFWTLSLIVIVKYLLFVLRADNKGEGGILALAALVLQKDKLKGRRIAIPILFALFGAGLLFGEGLITPAISVLSAVEGLSEQNPSFAKFVIPIAVAILIGLFVMQKFGTGKIGAVFGWVMLVWFIAIGGVAVPHILANPHILTAVNPLYAIEFMAHHGVHGFLLLGSVVLCVTGCEALYADMGHFGRTPIRLAWSTVVYPGLLLNYFGQGALFLERGASKTNPISNPFYDLVSGTPLLIPMIILATMAAIIASQALISGAFSLTNQAVQLGYLPRVTVIHTSSKHEGQIYIPEINYLFLFGCVALVLAFKSSKDLAAAYGIAVTGTMAITSFLIFLVCQRNWGWSLRKALLLYIPFAIIDGVFFSANLVKVAAGGWFPLVVGALMFATMTTWWRGRHELSKIMETGMIPDDLFLADIAETPMPRVSGTAVFMASGTEGMPNVLLHHVKHNKVLHKQVVLLSLVTENVPFVVGSSSIAVRDLGQGFFRVVARIGFVQQPNVPRILQRCGKHALVVNEADTTYYLGRQTLLTSGKSRMARWRKMLFSFLSHNSRSPTTFFKLPPNRVVELGLQIEL